MTLGSNAFYGEKTRGTWTLKVPDSLPNSVGTLNLFKLNIMGYQEDTGKEWLKKLTPADRKTIGDDMRTVELGWPIGMPVVKKVDTDLWEVRSNLPNSRISRVLFTVSGQMMILLHGFHQKEP